MVGARTAVKQQHYRLFSHDWSVRDEAGTIDVEKQTNAIYGYIHDEETLTLGLREATGSRGNKRNAHKNRV
jgi:hypothetical protein